MLEKSPKEAIVAEAKNIIDAHLKAKEWPAEGAVHRAGGGAVQEFLGGLN